MAVESSFNDLLQQDTLDANKILHELLDYTNIDTKTEISDPITFAMLESFCSVLEDMLLEVKQQKIKLPITTKLLKTFITQLKKFLVSWDRQGRIEITETLKATREQANSERGIFQKLTGMGK